MNIKIYATNDTDKWSETGGHSPMVPLFNSIHPISKGAVDFLNNKSYPVRVNKGKFLLKAGQVPDRLFLLRKGVVRGFIKEEKKEITTWITGENELVSSIRGLGLPPLVSEENIQVIESAQLVGLEYRCIDYMYKHFPESNIVARIILEEIYRAAEERAFISRIPSAEKKYKRFIDTKPELADRISLKYIASYLSMTQETLSRIRTREARRVK
ncbi:MAG: Crp/Fnr family transcriptional regulator [Chitinophagaceae bacterium]|jgi:CRP-like cAMP-binding protein|nr:Crp/Fnr family transcriptional regulator [Chitinophagaceae bacterium]